MIQALYKKNKYIQKTQIEKRRNREPFDVGAFSRAGGAVTSF